MTEPYFAPIPQVGVEITNRCNLACRHCFNDSGVGPEQLLTLAELSDLFTQVRALGQTRIRLSGGEPTLHPDFAAVVAAAHARGLAVSINSHGLFSAALREQLAALPIALFIISLDGLREANDALRGSGVYDRVVETIRWLVSSGRAVTLGVHLCRANVADIPGLAALAVELGVGLKVSPLRPMGRAREALREEILSPVDFYHAVRTLTHLRTVYPDLALTTDFDILRSPPALTTTKPPLPARASCPAGRTLLNINYDGYVYPCAFLVTPGKEFAAGSIRTAALAEIWQRSPAFLPFRTLVKDPQCQACAAYGQTCVGGCVAMAYALTGQLEAHDPTCFAHCIALETLSADDSL